MNIISWCPSVENPIGQADLSPPPYTHVSKNVKAIITWVFTTKGKQYPPYTTIIIY